MSNKPSLVMLSGFLCDSSVWSKQTEALEPYAEIIIPSFRGMNSLKSMALSVLEQAPERFSVVGHSMGGRVAFELIHMACERIDKFAVMDSSVHPVQNDEKNKRQTLIDIAKKQGMEELANQWAPPIVNPQNWSKGNIMDTIKTMALTYSVEELEGQINALLSRKDQSTYLKHIKQKVLLICGEKDTWSPVSQHQEIAQQLQNSELVIINNSGHMATLEEPEKVNQILLKWFLH